VAADLGSLFAQWDRGTDPYATTEPSIVGFNPAKFYAQNLPLGHGEMDEMRGSGSAAPPPPGTVSFSHFISEYGLPFAGIAVAIWLLEGRRRGLRVGVHGGVST